MITFDEETERLVKLRRSEAPSKYEQQQARLDRILGMLNRINAIMDDIKSNRPAESTKAAKIIDATERFKKGKDND